MDAASPGTPPWESARPCSPSSPHSSDSPSRPGTPAAAALWLALALTVAHSFTTLRAAPLNFSQRAAAGDPARLGVIFDRFARWSTARATLQVLTLLRVTSALIASIAGA